MNEVYPITNFKHTEITDKMIHCFYKVYNTLGYGFLEKVYENSMLKELRKNNLLSENQIEIIVRYHGEEVGEYYADLLVENKVIIEIKATEELIPEHETQLVNYLRATEIEVGLLLNFGKKPEIKRKVFSNEHKNLQLS